MDIQLNQAHSDAEDAAVGSWEALASPRGNLLWQLVTRSGLDSELLPERPPAHNHRSRCISAHKRLNLLELL